MLSEKLCNMLHKNTSSSLVQTARAGKTGVEGIVAAQNRHVRSWRGRKPLSLTPKTKEETGIHGEGFCFSQMFCGTRFWSRG